MQEIIDQLRAAWPPVFAGKSIDDLSGGVFTWETLQNKRCAGEIPGECFVRSGPKVVVVRDKFLAWWLTTLRPAGEPTGRPMPPTPRAGQRHRQGLEIAAQSGASPALG